MFSLFCLFGSFSVFPIFSPLSPHTTASLVVWFSRPRVSTGFSLCVFVCMFSHTLLQLCSYFLWFLFVHLEPHRYFSGEFAFLFHHTLSLRFRFVLGILVCVCFISLGFVTVCVRVVFMHFWCVHYFCVRCVCFWVCECVCTCVHVLFGLCVVWLI